MPGTLSRQPAFLCEFFNLCEFLYCSVTGRRTHRSNAPYYEQRQHRRARAITRRSAIVFNDLLVRNAVALPSSDSNRILAALKIDVVIVQADFSTQI